AAAGATTDDFNSGKAAIGTGPFRFVSWRPGEPVVMERNPNYWGGPPPWERVMVRTIPVGSARVAALLAGDVDVIELVPPESLADLRARPEIAMSEAPFTRVLFLMLDQNRDRLAFATDRAGRPLDANPFKDVRVRRAISKA